MKRFLTNRWTKAAVFALSLGPAAHLVWGAFSDGLGANPLEFVTRATGDWTVRFLLITLTITPARRLLAQPELIRFRRMLGLFAFFYGGLHFLTYLWFDKFFDWPDIAKDIMKRPFITMGLASFLLMLPLAITSTGAWIRRLGGKRWQLLHRLVYFATLAGVIHYYWLVKSDVRMPLLYGAMLGLLMLFRAVAWLRRSASHAPTVVGAAPRFGAKGR